MKLSFNQLEVGKKYKVNYPWIAGYSVVGVLTSVENLNDEHGAYRQFVFGNGKNLVYDRPFAHNKKEQVFNTFETI